MTGHGPITPSEFCELLADADRPWPAHSSRWKLPTVPNHDRKRAGGDANVTTPEDHGECRKGQ